MKVLTTGRKPAVSAATHSRTVCMHVHSCICSSPHMIAEGLRITGEYVNESIHCCPEETPKGLSGEEEITELQDRSFKVFGISYWACFSQELGHCFPGSQLTAAFGNADSVPSEGKVLPPLPFLLPQLVRKSFSKKHMSKQRNSFCQKVESKREVI